MGGKGSGRRKRPLAPVKPLPIVRPICAICRTRVVERSVNTYRGRKQPFYRKTCRTCRPPVYIIERARQITIACRHCGREFTGYTRRRYCSTKCKNNAHWGIRSHRRYVKDACERCGLTHPDPRFFDVDHIVPKARGGAKRDPANLQTLCPNCHRLKTLADGPTQKQC